MFGQIREHFYKSRVRQLIAKEAGMPVKKIRLEAMPKNDKEFSELTESTEALSYMTWREK